MSDADEKELFVEAVSASIQGKRVQWEALSTERWLKLFRLAEAQKLLPLLAEAVWDCPAGDAEALLAAGKRTAKRQVMLQSQKDMAFWPVYEKLRSAGIDALVVKGSVCRSVYPNGALRISSDEDLLVEPERFAEACEILTEAGLTPAPGADPARDAEIGWRDPKGPLYIELHKYLFAPDSGPFGLLQTVFSDVFSRARLYQLEEGLSVRSLSPHDHLLYLLLHAMKHFIRSGFGLRQICDVGLWAAKWKEETDWELLARQTEAVRGRRFAAAVFAAAEGSLGIRLELPDPWKEDTPDPKPMLEDLLDAGIYGSAMKSREHTARITQDAVTAQHRGKRRSLRTALFPPVRDLEKDYPSLKTRPALLPVVWQIRLLHYLKQASASAEDKPLETIRLGKQRLSLLREYGILGDE